MAGFKSESAADFTSESVADLRRNQQEWLTDRRAELLPVPYFHVVFTLPGPIADITYHNKAVVYDLLLKAAAESVRVAAPGGFSVRRSRLLSPS